MSRLSRSFYRRPTLDVARDLIGKVLVHNTLVGLVAGVIVEVEAYIVGASCSNAISKSIFVSNIRIGFESNRFLLVSESLSRCGWRKSFNA